MQYVVGNLNCYRKLNQQTLNSTIFIALDMEKFTCCPQIASHIFQDPGWTVFSNYINRERDTFLISNENLSCIFTQIYKRQVRLPLVQQEACIYIAIS